ncbi:hypothetical protein M406DRAFT_322307 [Cryphonectria parasitica EP155]|uniref:Uncharacterized protein n=1 Tax=Cryphonectria parasitica (strain ATCC 38755 / EP155) TaxID=660469 RepID=A0A9P5CQB6_CRYP1|nr:uncharacterized protein M406DRAFT_322307 [Cryphonectria parasitica EP155]KAF3766277.1 hypothetical protein M406DRAFT_322307 [Cryphonectria parasitica EP155]
MTTPQVNGDVPASSFLKHLNGYPVVHDGVETFKANPYGQKSLQLGDSAYKTFAAPVLPYLSKPYQYVEPYVKRADDLGDKALAKVDEKFPVVKKPTGELYSDAKGIVLLPYNKAFEGRDHVLSVYSSEYKKVGGENGSGLILTGKAAVATALIITSETVKFIGDYLGQKKEQAHHVIDNKTRN